MSLRRIVLAGVAGAAVLGVTFTGYAVAGPSDKADKSDQLNPAFGNTCVNN